MYVILVERVVSLFTSGLKKRKDFYTLWYSDRVIMFCFIRDSQTPDFIGIIIGAALERSSDVKSDTTGWGSLENFFKDPSRAPRLEPNIDWMRTVSKEEAAEYHEQLLKWAESDKVPRGGELGEWVYGVQNPDPPELVQPQDIESLTPLALQRNWKTPVAFPHCPDKAIDGSLADYGRALEVDMVFSRNAYTESLVVMAELGDSLLSVFTRFSEEGSVKPWAVAKVTVENGKFVHESIRSFFKFDGARKEYSRLIGIELDIETIDDFC